MEKKTKVIGGTTFHEETPERVCRILNNAINSGRSCRVRLFYGDTKTGKDWFEVYDTMGYVGRSGGTSKIPLLCYRANSIGGGAILDYCIVKITIDKQVVYSHPKYYCPVKLVGDKVYDTEKDQVLYNGQGNEAAAKRNYDFFLGKRNNY